MRRFQLLMELKVGPFIGIWSFYYDMEKKKKKDQSLLDGQIRERTYNACHLTNLNDKTHCKLGARRRQGSHGC